jgi:hypothetical protein
MTFIVLAPLVVALTTAVVAWQRATRLDRQSLHEGWPDESNGGNQWHFVLGALVVAVLAFTALQTILLSGLRSLGG